MNWRSTIQKKTFGWLFMELSTILQNLLMNTQRASSQYLTLPELMEQKRLMLSTIWGCSMTLSRTRGAYSHETRVPSTTTKAFRSVEQERERAIFSTT
mmetsp:Transcript_8408/g.20681  ORF Transcript_8408/g.20681 Transcript_8408/m.20681 type:complete len:98 (+) Transcript_8408:3435-3728(+)